MHYQDAILQFLTMALPDPQDKGTAIFKTLGTTCTTKQCHIQEHLNLLSLQ